MNCKNWGTDTDFHVDELFAKRSNMPILTVALGVFLLVIITVYFLFFSDNQYVIIAFGLPFAVYFMLDKQDQKRVSDFNKRKLKGRTHNIG